jgi:GntR family transcriptional regulator
MDHEWNDSQPIYRQVRNRVVAMILDGVLKEGDPLPSVRNVAAEYRVNPLTVLKGYQQLVDEGLVESRRGLGMFINVGARDLLLKAERQKFLGEEWPMIQATIQRLGLKAEELLDGARDRSSSDAESNTASSKITEPKVAEPKIAQPKPIEQGASRTIRTKEER